MVRISASSKEKKTPTVVSHQKKSTKKDHGLPTALAEQAFVFDLVHQMRTKHRKLGLVPHAKDEETISDAEINTIPDEETRLRKKLEVEEKAFEDAHFRMSEMLENCGLGMMGMSTPSMLKQEQELKELRKSVLAYDLRGPLKSIVWNYVVEGSKGVISKDIEKWKDKFQDAGIWDYTEINAMFKFNNFNKKVLGDW